MQQYLAPEEALDHQTVGELVTASVVMTTVGGKMADVLMASAPLDG